MIVLGTEDYVIVGDMWLGRVCDIISFMTNGNYTKVTTVTGRFTIRKHSCACEARLPKALFFRASRGCLFNIGQVKMFGRHDSHRIRLVMEGDDEIIMGRTQTSAFRKAKLL